MIPSDQQWHESGDAQHNSIGCWRLAIRELRNQGLREGRYQPINEEEKRIAEGMNV